MTRPNKLSERERMLIEVYNGSNEVYAMRVAGFAGADAYLKSKFKDIMKDPRIADAYNDRAKYSQVITQAVSDKEDLMRDLTMIVKNHDPYARKTRDQYGNKSEDVPNIPIQSRLKALELLGKAQGAFIEKIEMTNTITLESEILKSYKIAEPIEVIEAEYYEGKKRKEIEDPEESEEEEAPKFKGFGGLM